MILHKGALVGTLFACVTLVVCADIFNKRSIFWQNFQMYGGPGQPPLGPQDKQGPGTQHCKAYCLYKYVSDKKEFCDHTTVILGENKIDYLWFSIKGQILGQKCNMIIHIFLNFELIIIQNTVISYS